jgi:predicted enzyme related to lactoylglutathione lyase
MPEPLFQKLDCARLPVPDLEAGLAFYGKVLCHELIWRDDTSAGLRIPGSDAELVLQTERPEPEIDLKVASAPDAVRRFAQAGGSIVSGPFEIAIGQAAVVRDPWGNELVLRDASKGLLKTDAEGRIVGNVAPEVR